MSKGLKVFITYAHKNSRAKDDLITHLAVMKQNGLIRIWHDNEILPGDKWRDSIFSNLADSDILLYLTSAYSLASENCNKELAAKLNSKIRVIPIILEHCDWENHQLSRFQALPDKGRPLNEWKPKSKGWKSVADGVRRTIEEMKTGIQEGTLPDWVFDQGNFMMMIGQIDEAIKAYSHVVKLNQRYADAYNNRGLAYEVLDALESAIDDYNTAIAIQPDDAVIYNNRGTAYLQKAEVDRAIADFDKAIKLNFSYTEAYCNRGIAYVNKDHVDRAITDFNKAIQLNPDGLETYKNRGRAYHSKEEYYRAIKDFDKVIQLKPNAEGYHCRGVSYNDIGKYDRALVDFNMAIKLEPDDDNNYNSRGLIYCTRGEVVLAIKDYTKAIQLNPIMPKFMLIAVLLTVQETRSRLPSRIIPKR